MTAWLQARPTRVLAAIAFCGSLCFGLASPPSPLAALAWLGFIPLLLAAIGVGGRPATAAVAHVTTTPSGVAHRGRSGAAGVGSWAAAALRCLRLPVERHVDVDVDAGIAIDLGINAGIKNRWL